jgi:DNA-directed RNA polymerase subunit M/transcription elongation factor TFIIS
MPPFQPDPSSPAPIWICPICQKLMRTRTIEVADGEEQTKLACATCGTEATQSKMLSD